MKTTIEVIGWCCHCGHPVSAEGVSLPQDEDYDRTGVGRDRCSDSACVSDARRVWALESSKTILEAIAESEQIDSIVHLDWTEESESELLSRCDDWTENGATVEYWGPGWRVHLKRRVWALESIDGSLAEQWTESACGDGDTRFATEAEAERARRALIALGEGWTEKNTRVRAWERKEGK